MKFDRAHQGQHRQAIGADEAAEQADAGLTPGITPDLHAPEISHPGEEEEVIALTPVAAAPSTIFIADTSDSACKYVPPIFGIFFDI